MQEETGSIGDDKCSELGRESERRRDLEKIMRVSAKGQTGRLVKVIRLRGLKSFGDSTDDGSRRGGSGNDVAKNHLICVGISCT